MVVLPLRSSRVRDGPLVAQFGNAFAWNDAETTEIVGANHVVVKDSHHQHGSLHVHPVLLWHRPRWKRNTIRTLSLPSLFPLSFLNSPFSPPLFFSSFYIIYPPSPTPLTLLTHSKNSSFHTGSRVCFLVDVFSCLSVKREYGCRLISTNGSLKPATNSTSLSYTALK